jgi:hypothetical protein
MDNHQPLVLPCPLVRMSASACRVAASALLFTATAACGPSEPEGAPPPTPEEIEAAALAEFEHTLSEAVARIEALAGSADRTLSPLPLITPGEEAGLRRFLNDTHVARAGVIGVRVENEAAREALLQEGRLVALADSTAHWIVRPRTAPALVVPEVPLLLAELGARFQARLAEMGLPAYRIEVTSALRTSERQAALRRTNPNAAAGVSSHEFGTTVDISYAAFAPPAELEPDLLAGVPVALRPYARRMAELALESVSARKSRELTKILGEVLAQAQAEGLVLVIYERQQTVFHLTVGRLMEHWVE